MNNLLKSVVVATLVTAFTGCSFDMDEEQHENLKRLNELSMMQLRMQQSQQNAYYNQLYSDSVKSQLAHKNTTKTID